MQDTLNDFISDGQNMAFGSESNCRTFDATNYINNAKDLDIIIFRMEDVEMQLPVLITLIFLSKEHATNVEKCSATQKMHYCLTGFTFRSIPRQKFIHCSFWNSGSQTNGTNTTKWRNYTGFGPSRRF
jgi:hypothetical protein